MPTEMWIALGLVAGSWAARGLAHTAARRGHWTRAHLLLGLSLGFIVLPLLGLIAVTVAALTGLLR